MLFRTLHKIFFLTLLLTTVGTAQSAWPSAAWNSAENLTPFLGTNGATELSGLHWDAVANRLFIVHGDGRLRILHINGDTVAAVSDISNLGGPEGITQVVPGSNEFYTVDENAYEIRRYTLNTGLTTATLASQWSLLAAPSVMENTGNTGPEGIAFVPDSLLTAKWFVPAVTGQPYISKKGMGGLFFIAHQDKGRIWVFDLDPTGGSFAYVGQYYTKRSESCDLAFDRTTGLLYILHNTGSNSLEVTDLSTTLSSGKRTFVTLREYAIPNPSGNTNIEGFTLTPRSAGDGAPVSAFLCRDVESGESSSYQKDCLRRFRPFTEPVSTSVRGSIGNSSSNDEVSVYPNPVRSGLSAHLPARFTGNITIRLYNMLGQKLMEKKNVVNGTYSIDVSRLLAGMYVLEVRNSGNVSVQKFVKQ